MRLVALISGGKDSLFNMLQCIAAGHEIVAVANIEPETKEELDSYMYQSVGHQAVSLIAVALGLPIYRQKTKGKAVCKTKTYVETLDDEVEDMLQLLQKVKKDMHIEGVSVGAILSDYQRTRVENVCSRLGLKCFAYLWRRNQAELLQEMIDADLDAIIIKVASIGLSPDVHLGMHIRDMKTHLLDINKKYGVNVCGEGGEYETLTTDCPLFHKKISITDSENLVLSNDAFAPVAFLNVKNATLKPKVWGTDDPVQSLQTRLAYVKTVVKDPYKYIEDCVDEVTFNRQTTATSEILPFPFEQTLVDDSKSSMNVSEYWKKNSMTTRGHHRVSFSPSTLSAFDTTTCNLNYSTGWCCIGNITGINIQETLACLQRHLDRTKYELQDVVFVNLFIREMGEFHSINKFYSQQMPDVMPPARACVATLLPADVNVLIIAVAHKFVSKSQKAISTSCTPVREAMHVQSISHWAPANIGPYSQCVRVGGLYYLSGQIPLIPGTMEILNKPIFHQCKLTLRHISRVIQAMNEQLNMANVLHATCYVTSEEIAYDIFHLWMYITKNETATVAVVVVTGLPKNAQLEWEVVACGFDNPRVHESIDALEDFSLRMRRCVFLDPYTSSFVCRVSALKKAEASRKQKEITTDLLKTIVKYCLQFIKKEVKNIGLHLCMLKLFHKYNHQKLGDAITDLLRTFDFDHKVVASRIPVVAFREPEVILAITGICH